MHATLDKNSPFEPQITAFVCNWCTYTGADLAGTSRLQMAPNVRIIRLPCTGRIDPLFILKAFERGADGVIVSGCHPADCHYTSGNYHARRRFAALPGAGRASSASTRGAHHLLVGLGLRGAEVARRRERHDGARAGARAVHGLPANGAPRPVATAAATCRCGEGGAT